MKIIHYTCFALLSLLTLSGCNATQSSGTESSTTSDFESSSTPTFESSSTESTSSEENDEGVSSSIEASLSSETEEVFTESSIESSVLAESSFDILSRSSSEEVETEDGESSLDLIADLSSSSQSNEVEFNEETVTQLFNIVGFKGVAGADDALKNSFTGVFGRLDSNGDNLIVLDEYIASPMFDETAATGIYNATDRDKNGSITLEEYIENRIITDEAKLIFEEHDTDGDGFLTSEEWVASSNLDEAIAVASFEAFDSDLNGQATTPEYLVVWGAWARSEY
ncbi:MAG: hypothetical protein OCD01_03965 [Fibrobacterales bacterium]